MFHSVFFSLLLTTTLALRLPNASNSSGQNFTKHQYAVKLDGKKTGAGAAVQAFEEAFATKHKFFEEAMKDVQLSSAELKALDRFEHFLKAHYRNYFQFGDKDEYKKRLGHFSKTLDIISIRNDYEKNFSTHPNPATHGITKYADWSEAEFKAILGHNLGEVEVVDDGKNVDVEAVNSGSSDEKEDVSWFGWFKGLIGLSSIPTSHSNFVTKKSVSQAGFKGSCAEIAQAYGCRAKLSDGRTMAEACPDECENAAPHNKYNNCADIYAQAGCGAPLASGEPMTLVCPVQCPPSENQPSSSSSTSSKVPCDKNWVSTTTIRNQGSCGDCWAFATVEAIRSAYINEHGTDPGKLSTQFLVDCMMPDKKCSDGVNGCCGGLPSKAMEWIETQGGIPTQAAYGDFFDAEDSSLLQPGNHTSLLQSGPVSNKGKGLTFSGNNPFTVFPCKSGIPKAVKLTGKPKTFTGEDNMASHVCNTGTLAIAVDASAWSTYTGGVLSSISCSTKVDHAVHAIGLDKKMNSWIVQNSWGEDYGVTADGVAIPQDKYSDCTAFKERFGCKAEVKGGMTVGEACPGSCASAKSEGGFVMLAYGANTCGIASPYTVATPSTGSA